MPVQPTLPNPTPFSDLEAAYLEDQPPGLFPENQDSNFGQYRKIFSSALQDVANQLDLIYNERFPSTSVEFLNFWEEEVGLPPAPSGESVATRQFWVQARIRRGRFTRTLRKEIIELFISATFGAVPTFGPGGIIIGSGIPLFSGVGNVTMYYKIVEDIPNFFYYVFIDDRVTPDLTGLNRELTRITSGGIGYAIGTLHQRSGGAKSSGIGGGTEAHIP